MNRQPGYPVAKDVRRWRAWARKFHALTKERAAIGRRDPAFVPHSRLWVVVFAVLLPLILGSLQSMPIMFGLPLMFGAIQTQSWSFLAKKDLAVSTIAVAPSPALSGVTLSVSSGHGARFPQPSTDGSFVARIKPSGVQATSSNAEEILVGARSTDGFSSITRAYNGTSAIAIAIGYEIALVDSEEHFTRLEQSTDASEIVCGSTPGYPATFAGIRAALLLSGIATCAVLGGLGLVQHDGTAITPVNNVFVDVRPGTRLGLPANSTDYKIFDYNSANSGYSAGVVLSAAPSEGAMTVSIAANTDGIAVGDMVRIGDTSFATRFERNKVRSVSGGTIGLYVPLSNTYTTSDKIWKVSSVLTNFKLSGEFDANGNTGSSWCAYIINHTNCDYSNIKTIGFNQGLSQTSSINNTGTCGGFFVGGGYGNRYANLRDYGSGTGGYGAWEFQSEWNYVASDVVLNPRGFGWHTVFCGRATQYGVHVFGANGRANKHQSVSYLKDFGPKGNAPLNGLNGYGVTGNSKEIDIYGPELQGNSAEGLWTAGEGVPVGAVRVHGGTIMFNGTVDIGINDPGAVVLLGDCKTATFGGTYPNVDIATSDPYGILANGGFSIWQRGGSLTNTDDTYFADRWYVLTQTASVSTSRQTGAIYTYESDVARITQTQASSQRFGLAQIVESTDSVRYRGRNVRFQIALAPQGASPVIRYAILEWTGTADAVTSDVVNDWTSSTYTAGNFFLGASLTVAATGSTTTANAVRGNLELNANISSACNNLIVLVWTSAVAAQNFLIDVSQAGLYSGVAHHAWNPHPKGAELSLCQRYYCKSFTHGTTPVQNAGANTGYNSFTTAKAGALTEAGYTVRFPVPMRASPTVTTFSPGNASAQMYNFTSSAATSGTTVNNQTEQSFNVFCTGDAGGAVGDHLTVHWTADAEL